MNPDQARSSRRTALMALSGATLALLAAPSLALAYDENSPADLNLDAQGVILRGHDAVAYQTEGRPVQGSPQHSATHQGATYHFASAANRDRFRADPARYAPAYGGFCAMGVALGRKLDGDPHLFRVADNRLYLNVNEAAQRRWLQDIPGHIRQAEAEWPKLRGRTPRQLSG